MTDEKPSASERVSPAECAGSVLKLILFFYFYVRHGSGVLDSEGNLAAGTGDKTNRLVRRVIADIDTLWKHGDKLFRNDAVVRRLLLLLIEIEGKRRSKQPIERDLEEIRRGWNNWMGEELTPSELEILILDADEKMGPTEVAQYRLGKMLDIGDRQVRKILHNKAATAPHFWGQESPLDTPLPDVARYIAALYFFRDVLRWPTPDETNHSARFAVSRFVGVFARLTDMSVRVNWLLARASAEPPAT